MALQNTVVLHVDGRRGTGSRPRTWEHIRLRMTFQRKVMMGRYISVTGHRSPGSIQERTIIRYWDAVICHSALVRFRRRMAGKKRQPWDKRRDIKRWAVVVAAECLAEGYAPVNAHTIEALLGIEGMAVSRWYLNRSLSDAGWRHISGYETPKGAPGFPLTNWVSG